MRGPGGVCSPGMPALSESRWLRYFAFTALYLAQGLPWGFIAVGYVVFLADQGLDETQVGAAIGVAYIPWSFKILAGPALDVVRDTRFGRRRPFVIAAQLAMGLSLLALLAVDPVTQLFAVSVILFVHNSAAAIQDVASDALAVDLLPENERGRANSFMWAGKSAGIAIGGGAGTVLAKYWGWDTLFVVLALAIWAVMLVPILIRERPVGEAAPITERLSLGTLWRSFNFRTPWLGLIAGLLTPVGYALVGTVFTRMLRAELELGEEQIGFLSGIVEPLAGVVGALIGGFLADRYGARMTMGGAMAAIAVALAVFGVSPEAWPSYLFLVGWVIGLQLAINAYNAASFGFYMTLSNPAIGATQFAAYMAVTNLTYAWTSPAGGWMAKEWGYTELFLVAAGLQLVTIGLLPLVDPRVAETRYRMVGAAPSMKQSPAG